MTTRAAYEVVVGLEVHLALRTRTKLFCACATPADDDPPNARVCPVCLGLPGALPVANAQAVALAVRFAAALDCGLTVNPEGAKNQVEGSIVMGMGAALYEAFDFQGGRLLNAGFARYRTPVRNYYQCGSATHPGGGILGASGRLAALEILRDWKA